MIVNGRRHHHVLDARTGESRSDIRSVTILAPTALQADVFATTCMAMGLERGKSFLSRHVGVRAVIIASEGKTHQIGFEGAQ